MKINSRRGKKEGRRSEKEKTLETCRAAALCSPPHIPSEAAGVSALRGPGMSEPQVRGSSAHNLMFKALMQFLTEPETHIRGRTVVWQKRGRHTEKAITHFKNHISTLG